MSFNKYNLFITLFIELIVNNTSRLQNKKKCVLKNTLFKEKKELRLMSSNTQVHNSGDLQELIPN